MDRHLLLFGAGTDDPLLTRTVGADGGPGERFFYHKDGLNSVREITNGEGKVVRRNDYDTFGNMTTTGCGGATYDFFDTYAYTGRQWDEELDMYYYRARYYDAAIGRFISPDPVWSTNLYSYVNNDPVNFVDPSGKFIQAFMVIQYIALALQSIKFNIKTNSSTLWTLTSFYFDISAKTAMAELAAIKLFVKILYYSRTDELDLHSGIFENIRETLTWNFRGGACADWQEAVYNSLGNFPLKFYEVEKVNMVIHFFIKIEPLGNYNGIYIDLWGLGSFMPPNLPDIDKTGIIKVDSIPVVIF